MTPAQFQNAMRKLRFVEPHQIGLAGMEAKRFEDDPLKYIARADEATAAAILAAIQPAPARFATSA